MANLNGGGFWRTMYGIFRISRTLAIVIALAVSLAVNVTLFVGGVLYNFVDDFLEDVTGLQTASAKQRKVVRSLQKENRQLRGQINVARTAAKRTVDRSGKFVRRSLTTLAGKALPYAGAAVSAGVTVLEIKDLCETIGDMNSIRREIDPSEATDDNESTVCSMPVPPAERILSQIAISPQKAWEESKNFVSDLNFPTSVRHFPAKLWKDIKSFSTYWNEFYFRRHEDSDRGN